MLEESNNPNLSSRHSSPASHPSKNLLCLTAGHLWPRTRLLTLFRLDGLIDRDNHGRGLGSRFDGIDFDECGFPYEFLKVVCDTLGLDIDSSPGFAAGVTHAQFVEDVGAVEASVIAELTGDDFEGAGVSINDELLFSLDCSCVFTEVFRDFHLTSQLVQKMVYTSQAPPPATIWLFLIARLTIIMASCNERSTSAINCSAPPRRIRVQVFATGQPSKRLYLSPPI